MSDDKKAGHGGKRPGAGRPGSRLPPEVIAALDDPPDDPLEMQRWSRMNQAKLWRLYVKTGKYLEFAKNAKIILGPLARQIPVEALLEAAGRLKADEDALKTDAGAQEVPVDASARQGHRNAR